MLSSENIAFLAFNREIWFFTSPAGHEHDFGQVTGFDSRKTVKTRDLPKIMFMTCGWGEKPDLPLNAKLQYSLKKAGMLPHAVTYAWQLLG